MANSNSAPPTSSSSDNRSSPPARFRTAGHANSRGITDHSLASSTGIATSPIVVCNPWLSAYDHAGEPTGRWSRTPMSWLGAIVALLPSSG